MPKYQIRGALGGGFGGVKNAEWETIEAASLSDAETAAYDEACRIYEGYEGMYGLRSVADIIEEDGVEDDEAEEIWREEREGWLDYEARKYINEEEDDK